MLDVIEGGEVGEDVEVPLAVIVGSIGAPTYSPTDATVSAAISSGKIELIRDHELRTACLIGGVNPATASAFAIVSHGYSPPEQYDPSGRMVGPGGGLARQLRWQKCRASQLLRGHRAGAEADLSSTTNPSSA